MFDLRMFVFHQVQKSPHSGECRDGQNNEISFFNLNNILSIPF